MKYILIFLFSISAQANVQYLSYDSTGLMFVDSRTEGSKTPYTRVCPGIEGERVASDYKVEILEPGTLPLTDTRRDWTQGDTLANGESVVCSIDDTKKATRIADEQKKIDDEKAIKDKKDLDWKALCLAEKGTLWALRCLERGFEIKP